MQSIYLFYDYANSWRDSVAVLIPQDYMLHEQKLNIFHDFTSLFLKIRE
jgi:hypothetical protein